jgi:hypothetical protein
MQGKTADADSEPRSGAKAAPGSSWNRNEVQNIPKNNLPVVFLGLALCVFLAAIDQVCVVTLAEQFGKNI